MKLESTIPYIKKGAPRCDETTKKTKNINFAVASCNMIYLLYEKSKSKKNMWVKNAISL